LATSRRVVAGNRIRVCIGVSIRQPLMGAVTADSIGVAFTVAAYFLRPARQTGEIPSMRNIR